MTITLKELAIRLDTSYGNIITLIKKDILKRLLKTSFITKKSNNGRKEYKRKYRIYVIDEENIEEFDRIRKQFQRSKVRHDGGRYWTRTSIECYENKMSCTNCPQWIVCRCSLNEYGAPTLKDSVREIFAKYGKPIKKSYDYYDYESEEK